MTHYLILPVGPPACGKSTLRAWLLERGFSGYGIVCPDDIREVLTGDAADQTANDAVFTIANQITKERLDRGLNVYVDATNLRKATRDELFNMAHGADATILMVLFDTSQRECLRRNDHRVNPVPRDVMGRMFHQHAEITNFTLRREAGPGTQVYTPDQFMSYSWGFLPPNRKEPACQVSIWRALNGHSGDSTATYRR